MAAVPDAVRSSLSGIAARDSELNSFVHLDDAAPGAPAVPGPLSGRPVAVKDNIAVRGAPWGCGSATRRAERPAHRDAEVVRRLREAGAVVIGTTNLDEFAMGASTESSAWGPTLNPWDTERSPGGSSGGSAAAAAAYDVLALGTDTGGSIREPAAQCGVVGVKPSHGGVPLDGVVPFAPSLDTVGPLARTVADAALLHDVLAGSTPQLAAAAEAGRIAPMLADLTIGVVEQMSGDRNSPEICAQFVRACEALVAHGARLRHVQLARTGEALPTYYAISSAEALIVLESHAMLGELGDEAAQRLEIARTLGGSDQLREAFSVREMVARDVGHCFESCDVLVSPTMPLVAPPLGRRGVDDPLAIPRTDWWTVEANLAGVPAMSMPCGVGSDTGLPVGLQLMAPHGLDARLYRVAAAIEPDLAQI
ncbi:amidase [Solicola gregarius]|uniref:Amidase family protein n=1 Tax=Solicola gregarius TaxID=2908642 RepID=A0AA46TFX7_9ACTN|nr:amidase [Solicola gregarius]UYM04082.1 amidase family protein [Solicola gregarius]